MTGFLGPNGAGKTTTMRVILGLDAAAIGDLAAGHGIAVHVLVPRQASLEDAYLELTGGLTEYRGGTR